LSGVRKTLMEWDPLDPQELVDPYPTFALARREAPVFYNAVYDAWIVTRYDDVLDVVKDTKRFSSSNALDVGELHAEVKALLPGGLLPGQYPTLVNNDPPDHTRIRRLVQQAFKPRDMAAREDQIRAMADRLIDAFIEDGTVEFVHAFADQLPGLTICNIVGVPDEDVGRVVDWAGEMMAMFNPALPDERKLAAAHEAVRYNEYVESFIEERRRQPREDLMSGLIAARSGETGDEALSTPELMSTMSQLLDGGNDTTSNMIGTALVRLLQHPEQLAAVAKNPELAEDAVEESLRHATSVKGIYRNATTEVGLAGVTIGVGDNVVPMWASGNHDETKFERAEDFDIFRKEREKHMAFSRYAHFCIGAPLARIEIRVAIQQVLARMPNLRIVGETPWLKSIVHAGPARLQLAWDTPQRS
jgi:cytochrome P450